MTTYYLSRWDCYRLGAMSVTVTESVAGAVLIAFTATTENRFYHGDATDNTEDGTLPADGGTRCFGVALQTALNTTGVLANTYTVTFAATTGLYTIARATGSATFALTFSSLSAAGRRMRQALGFSGDKSAGTTFTSDRAPYFFLAPAGGRTDDSGRQRVAAFPAGVVTIASGGRVYGAAPYSTAYGRSWDQSYQSDAACHNALDTTADGDVWTWERFFEHHRSGERFLFFPFGTTVLSYANRERAYHLSQAGLDDWSIERVVPHSDMYWLVRLAVIERDQGDPAGAGAVLLDLSAGSTLGTFTRASVGTYQTSANTIHSVAADTRRWEDRGDGYGPLLLLEGAATNINTESEDIDSGSAWGQEYLTGTDGYMAAPDGSIEGDRLVSSASGAGYNREFLYALIGASSTYTFSVWYRDGTVNTGAHDYSIGISVRESVGSTLVYTTVDIPPTGSWTRASVTKTGEGTTEGYSMLYVNDNGQSGPRAAVGDDVVYYGAQLELGRFATSYIVSTSGSSTTRAADSWTINNSSVPVVMKTGRWQWAVCPLFADTDLVSGDIYVLMGVYTTANALRIRHDGTGVRVEAYEASTVRAYSGYLTFSRHQRLTITIDCAAGTIGVTGATTGDGVGATGTAWTWPTSGTVRIGGNVGATAEAFCRVASPRTA